jgi:hypothetical protein
MSKKIFIKDPDGVLDYDIDWTDWLNGDTINTGDTDSTWTVPTGITKDSDSKTTTGTIVWVSGGTVGQDYKLVNHITTVAGREDDRTIIIKVREK